MREKLSLQERKLLEHHETELCSPSHRFGPTVRIELGENGGDVKLGGVEGDSQPTCESQQQTAATTKVLRLRSTKTVKQAHSRAVRHPREKGPL
jgi:hypothetical protein